MDEGLFPAIKPAPDWVRVAAEDAAALGGPVSITLESPVARFSLRGRPGDAAALAVAFGAPLPDTIGRRAEAGARLALKLGPDEWVLRAPAPEAVSLTAAFAALGPETPHSLVEVSAREVALTLDGARAAELLAIGCPRDLATLPVGEGRRTIFDSATITLEREAETRFRLEVWRSFAPHVLGLLGVGNRELAIGL